MSLRPFAVAAALLSIAAAPAPTFDTARVATDIKTLSSDAFEGRGPGEAGEAKATAYIAKQFAAAGLEPGGTAVNGRRGWSQEVPLLRSTIAGTPTVSAGGQALVQGRDIALRAPLTGQKQVAIRNAPLVFAGYGVTAPERRWDDFKGEDMTGKVVVMLVNDPDFETGQGDFGGKEMTYYGRWTYKYEEGARRHAAGVLIVHEDKPASYGWATVANSNTNAQFDVVSPKAAASHTPMEGWIKRAEAVALFKASGLDFDAEKKKAQARNFRPVTLKPRFDATYAADVGVIRSKNVVGRLPGRTHPDETVIYSAHWDHLGIGKPDATGDRIYNGALDNASGVAALIGLGRAFAKAPRTDRSLVFLAVTAEEKGLLGSTAYVADPLYPLATTAGVFNMDGPFGFGATRDFTVSGTARLTLLDLLKRDAAAQGRTYSPDSRPEAGSFFRSDHFPFAKAGVPAVSYNQGIDLVNGGTARGRALRDAYTRDRYHQPADQWSDDWDLGGVPQALGLLYAAGRDLADGRDWPTWDASSEFRAARDATAPLRK